MDAAPHGPRTQSAARRPAVTDLGSVMVSKSKPEEMKYMTGIQHGRMHESRPELAPTIAPRKSGVDHAILSEFVLQPSVT